MQIAWRRFNLLWTALAFSTVALTACGGGSGGGSTPLAQPASNPGAPAPKTATSTPVPTSIPTSGPTSGNLVYTTYTNADTFKILAFPTGTGGNIAPAKTITSDQNDLWYPSALAFDSSGNLYVLNNRSGTGDGNMFVSVFARGSSGTVTPIRRIAGTTAFPNAQSLNGAALDAYGNLYIAYEEESTNPGPGCGIPPASDGCGAIAVFGSNSNGDVSPSRTITWNTCSQAVGVAVAPNGEIVMSCWVFGPNTEYGEIGVFAAGCSGNSTPIRVISGTNTGLGLIRGMAFSAVTDSVLVLPVYPSVGNNTSIFGYPESANGNVAPTIDISGSSTQLNAVALGVDSSGVIYALNQSNSSSGWITEYAANANGNASPTYVISGSNTGLNGNQLPIDIAVGPP